MSAEILCLSLDSLREVASLSHVLSWREFKTYTLILSRADENTSLVRLNQEDMSEASGFSLSTVKRHLNRFRSLGLMRIWRGPGGSNHYQMILPLSNETIQCVRERLPDFGVEPKRRQRKKMTTEDTITHVREEEPLSLSDRNTKEITNGPEAESSSAIHEYSGPALDPQMSSLLDSLEKQTVRNTVCRFLEFLGVLEPQLAMDQAIVVDRESLFAYLIEHDANSFDRFAELCKTFVESGQQLPNIDVPKSFPMHMHLHNKLDLHLCGMQWLSKEVRMRNDDGIGLLDREIRQNLFDFMKENGLKNFDDVIKLCKSKHDEIVRAKGNRRYVTPEQFGLGQYIQ